MEINCVCELNLSLIYLKFGFPFFLMCGLSYIERIVVVVLDAIENISIDVDDMNFKNFNLNL